MITISNIRPWRVRGPIIGPRLPRGILHVGPCTISPATQDDVERLQELAPPEFSIATLSSQGVVIFPIRTQLKSHHIFSFEVAAETQDQALSRVAAWLKKILSVLTLATNGIRYHAKVLSAARIGDTKTESIPSGELSLTVYGVQDLKVRHRNRVERFLTAAENETVARCLEFLGNAWQLWDAVSSAPVQTAILQNYFFVLETISDKVALEIRKSSHQEMTKNRASRIRRFIENSVTIPDDECIVSMFRNTDNEVRQIAIEYQSLELKHSGGTLTLDEQIINNAIELNKLRNQILSHPPSLEETDLNEWLQQPGSGKPCKAEATCRAYLVAYIKHLEAKDASATKSLKGTDL